MEVQPELQTFRPSPSQARHFKAIQEHITNNPELYRDAAAFITKHYSMKAIRRRELQSRPPAWRRSLPKGAKIVRISTRNKRWFRLCQFAADGVGRPGEQPWDLSTLSDRERVVRARAVCYVMWLLMDPDASNRGVGLTDLEQAGFEVDDFPAKGRKRGAKSLHFDRRWARMTVLDMSLQAREAWLRLVEAASDEAGVNTDREPSGHDDDVRLVRFGRRRAGPRRKYNAAETSKLVRSYRSSGLTVKEFADRRGVPVDDLRKAVDRERSASRRTNEVLQAKSARAGAKPSER